MSTQDGPSSTPRDKPGLQPGHRLHQGPGGAGDDVLYIDVWGAFRHGWMLIAASAVLLASAAAVYGQLAEPWYRAEALLAPADERSLPQGLGALGGLANLAGISISAVETAEPLAVLRSRQFAAGFIEERKLLPVIFANMWDSTREAWKESSPERQPDLRDATAYFTSEILSIAEDKRSSMFVLSVQWRDPVVASEWANALVDRLNMRMRMRALAESEKNIDYLRKEMNATNLPAMQQSIGRVLESEIQRMLLARGNDQYSFKVIDPATPPRSPYKPKRMVLMVGAGVFGVAAALFFLLLRQRFVGKAS